MSVLTMSPPTSPSAGRPPILPPTTTTFSGDIPPDDEPHHEKVLQSANHLLTRFYTRPLDDIATSAGSWHHALQARERLVERELSMLRLLSDDVGLPPTAFTELFTETAIGFEPGLIEQYLKVLDQIRDAIRRVEFDMEQARNAM